MGNPLSQEMTLKVGRFSLAWSRGAIAAAALFWAIVTLLLLHRHYGMYPSYTSFDQGIFNQLFWNGTHGRFFQSSLSSTLSTPVVHDDQLPQVFYHRLGQHFTPALLLWHPLYWLLSSSATLLVLQVTLVTTAGLVLYHLARHSLNPGRSTLITFSYYAANAVIGPTLANFHDLSQLPLYLFSLFLALEKRCWWVFWLMAGLTLLVREDTGVALFSIGVYLVLSRRYPRLGLAVCTVSFGYMLLLTNLIMPLFSEDISRRFMIEQFGQYVDGSEASTLDVIWGMLRNPGQVLVEFVTPIDKNLMYLLGHWLPLGFVPVISPATWALVGFPLLKVFIRQDPIAISINLRYAMEIVPGLFYGAILWWAHHPEAFTPRWQKAWITGIALSLVLTITSNPNRSLSFLIPDSIQPWVYSSPAQQWRHVGVIRDFIAQISPNASVSATTHIVPHLSSRRELVRFPQVELINDARQAIEVDDVLLDVGQLYRYQVAFADDRDRLKQTVRGIDRLLRRERYGAIGFEEGVLWLHRGEPSNPDILSDWLQFRQTLAPILSESDRPE